MHRNWPIRTLAAFGAAVGIDALIILVSSVPLACGNKDHGSSLAAIFTIIAVLLLVGGPSTLVFVGLRDALERPVPSYALIIVGVPLIIALSIWAIGSAFGASSCGSSFLIMGG